MSAPISQAVYVASVVAAAQARGTITAEAISRIEAEAADFWQARLNQSFSGRPSGSVNPN